ncbi:serine/arginine-rich splicing factor 9 isoform X2 [Sarcophilus harrisii]|uniref:serine/arginine-rich splicing factor 9 isoform X2 n=1 Tax=Sarcophilus harrisii TaxID=9305 RepID=UPI001301D496|nr:serine/arginine-rich splicing factor 9 isoform X2 [Sarcophilus harrisii]
MRRGRERPGLREAAEGVSGMMSGMSGWGEEDDRGSDNDGRIYVGNLPADVREKDLEDLFYKYGRIRDIELKNRRGLAPFAFVRFEDPRWHLPSKAYRDCLGPSLALAELLLAGNLATTGSSPQNPEGALGLELELSGGLISSTLVAQRPEPQSRHSFQRKTCPKLLSPASGPGWETFPTRIPPAPMNCLLGCPLPVPMVH